MASTYNYLGIELMATGENAGTLGTKTNTNLNIIQQAASGYHSQSVSLAGTGANTTALLITDGDSTSTADSLTNAARNAVLELTGTITGNKIVTFPDGTEGLKVIFNNTSGGYTVQLKGASDGGSGTTFSTTDKGYKLIYMSGSNLVDVGAVTLTGTQTLTNKTLTSPAIGTSILDTNGLQLANITATGSAVNEFTIANAAAGAGPTLSATGDETNVDINVTPKGSGKIALDGIKWPNADGSADQILTTDGSGVLSFVDNSGGTSWQAVVTGATKTAVAGEGYFIDTTSNACNVTLPSGTLGDEVTLVDYAATFDTNNLTVTPASGEKIQGQAADTTLTCAVERAGFTLAYSGATQGWLLKDK